MNAFEIERQRELSVLNDALKSLKEKVEAAINKEGADKAAAFAVGIAQYIEFKFNIVMLEKAFESELEDHMFIPLAVLSKYVLKETEAIEELYKQYGVGDLALDDLTAKIDEHVKNLIDARLGVLRLGKLDA